MMFLLLGNNLWSEEVNNYFQIYALSIPAFAIAETNIQAILALGRYKQVMGIGLLAAALIFGLTHGLTNGIEISNKTIINKQGNKGLPLAMAISHVVLALMITIWMHCDKSFDKYKLKRCEHCYTRVKQIKKLIRLGIPLAIKEIATNSYELVFTAILVKLGSSAELMASITDQAFMLMAIPLIATSRTLTQKLGIDYGKWMQSSSDENNQIIQNNVKNQVKASLTIQYLFLAIPMSTFIIAPDKVTRLCESLSDSQNSLNQEQQNDLNLIIQILTVHMLIHSFSHISNSVCNSFQNTFTPMLLEFLDCALNSAAGWFFLKEKGLVAIDIGYIPTEFLNGVLLIYVANKIINNIKNPFNAPPTEELNIQGDNSTVVLQVAHQDNPKHKKRAGTKRPEDYCAL